MTQFMPVALDLPVPLILALGQAARDAGVTPTDFVILALTDALHDRGQAPGDATAGVRQALCLASDWLDLQRRLRQAGHVLRRHRDGGLYLHDWPFDRPVLPLSDLGYTLAGLTLRFAAPFPGEPVEAPLPRLGQNRAA